MWCTQEKDTIRRNVDRAETLSMGVTDRFAIDQTSLHDESAKAVADKYYWALGRFFELWSVSRMNAGLLKRPEGES